MTPPASRFCRLFIQTIPGLVIGVFVSVLIPAPVHAATSDNANLTQRILPMDCVFNEVNDGLGTLTFITPAECGVIEPEVTQQLTPALQDQTTTTATPNNQDQAEEETIDPAINIRDNSETTTGSFEERLIPITRDSINLPSQASAQPETKDWFWITPVIVAIGIGAGSAFLLNSRTGRLASHHKHSTKAYARRHQSKK